MLYADDTKIWRHILAPIDHEILQRDIASLNARATLNKMKFHPENVKYCLLTTLTTVVSHIYAYDRAKTLTFILFILRKSTEFENESNV